MNYSRGGNRGRRGVKDMRGGYYGGGGGREWDHDDRGEEGTSPHTSRYAGGGDGGGYRGRGRGRGRGGGGFARGMRRIANHITKPFRRRTGQVETIWNKVVIPQGRSFGGRDKIMESLEDYLSEPLHPVLFRFDMGDAVFYLEDSDKASSLRAANKRITTSSGQRMSVLVTKAPAPYVPLLDNEINVIKEVLSKRYNSAVGHLDLSRFSLDTDFKQLPDVHMSLQRNNVMMAVVKIIQTNCPEVKSIDLSDNRLRFLDYLGVLVFRARGVQRLLLPHNQIDKPQELEKLRGWQLVEIDLDHNPICNRFTDTASYKSAIHKVFPKVTKLDGTDIEPSLGFGAIEEALSAPDVKKKLPTFLPGFYVNETLQKLIQAFVVEYLSIYDQGANARQNLLAAYDQDATFTMIMGNLDSHGRYKDSTMFGDMQRDSHNVVLQDRWERYRSKIVNHGGINVISKLTKLPKTEHIRETLLVDITFASDSLMCFVLQGLFRDGNEAGSTPLEELLANMHDVRFFSRTFTVVPRGQGVSVVNDMLYIMPVSPETASNHLLLLQRAQTNAAAPAAAPMSSGTQASISAPSLPIANAEQQKAALIERFSSASKMKRTWSQKCLEDNQWNFEKAAEAFKTLNDSGSIPTEAWETAL